MHNTVTIKFALTRIYSLNRRRVRKCSSVVEYNRGCALKELRATGGVPHEATLLFRHSAVFEEFSVHLRSDRGSAEHKDCLAALGGCLNKRCKAILRNPKPFRSARTPALPEGGRSQQADQRRDPQSGRRSELLRFLGRRCRIAILKEYFSTALKPCYLEIERTGVGSS
ncbi:hypothetical protein L596_003945 [Steinernema carpocapsae]|uniref:Uncharacterized protein n=1 Tax=Steinernema carpocapsae TaxID=34508 RepID=A0A4U8UXJ5_STECR|nr:hypothetical protein L596_003945 [Steinernema carpocapsae]